MTRVIIDAYNLIFQCGLQPKKLDSPQALKRTRDRLFRELAERIDDRSRSKVVIVFDAKRRPDETAVNYHGFDVRYAFEFDDADSMIIQLISQHSQPKKLTVVSSDHQIQTAASRRGATAIDSDVWFDSLRLTHTENVEDDEKQPLLSEEEQALWIANMQLELSQEDQAAKEAADDAPQSERKDAQTWNPFPDGYADDLLE